LHLGRHAVPFADDPSNRDRRHLRVRVREELLPLLRELSPGIVTHLNALSDMLATPGSTVVNTKDVSTGDTALHIVVARRDDTWIRFLAAKGANVNARNNKGETPLQLASNLGFVEGVETLIKLGAKVDEPNSTGETPLISATHRKDAGLARVLLKAGANARRNDNSGRSAYDYAMLDGRSNPVLTEIENAAKEAEAKPKAAVYGPKF